MPHSKRRHVRDFRPRFFPDHHEYLLGIELDEVLEEHEHAPEGDLGFEPYSVALSRETVAGVSGAGSTSDDFFLFDSMTR